MKASSPARHGRGAIARLLDAPEPGRRAAESLLRRLGDAADSVPRPAELLPRPGCVPPREA